MATLRNKRHLILALDPSPRRGPLARCISPVQIIVLLLSAGPRSFNLDQHPTSLDPTSQCTDQLAPSLLAIKIKVLFDYRAAWCNERSEDSCKEIKMSSNGKEERIQSSQKEVMTSLPRKQESTQSPSKSQNEEDSKKQLGNCMGKLLVVKRIPKFLVCERIID